jgi:hypothetical protein
MDNILPFLPLALILLACPLMMGAMGVGVWILARARGEKKKLSMGCMMGQCEHEEHAQQDAGLKEQVTHLEREVQTLRAQVGAPTEPKADVLT